MAILDDERLLDDREAIRSVDPAGMGDLIMSLPEQWRKACAIAREATVPAWERPERVLVLGLGGSAIGGDLVRSLLEGVSPAPIAVNRDYGVPAYVDDRTVVIASSYSGGTEETLSAVREAEERGARVIAITTGGELGDLAREKGWPVIRLPGGLSPRAAIGYSFVPLLVTMERLGLCGSVDAALAETASVLERQRERYGLDVPASNNPAKRLALELKGRLPLIYGSRGWKGAAAYRWKTQINENAKAPAYWNVFPELNHNETVGWESPAEVMGRVHLVILRDETDSPRVKARVDITREIMEGAVGDVTELWAEGDSDVARLFSLIYPGDFVSYYLALAYRNDPTPIKMIDLLKSRLAALG